MLFWKQRDSGAKHHLGYDQTKYVVEQARRRLKLEPPGTRRRTVDRLDKPEVESLTQAPQSVWPLPLRSGSDAARGSSHNP